MQSVMKQTERRVSSLIAGKWRAGKDELEVIDPYTEKAVSIVTVASRQDVEDAVTAAVGAQSAAAVPGYKRAELLRNVQRLVGERVTQIASAITRETGKPIRDAQAEVRRSVETIGFCAEEAIRIEGKHVPLDGSELGAGKLAMLLRFPVGVVGAIVPFNAPFNMACHKIAPAIAGGNSVVFKAPLEAPSCIQMLAQAFIDAQIAPGVLNILQGGAEVGEDIVRDSRVGFVSFTGSTRAGIAVRAAAGLKRVTLELGGLGPNIVHADANAEEAAVLCAINGTRLAGQSCVSVQNLFVHEAVLKRFMPALIAKVQSLKVGDPTEPTTDVGPLISRSAAERVETWVNEAQMNGATIVCGGSRDRAFYAPTVLTDVTTDMKVVCQEIFGPVIVVRPYTELSEVIAWINSTGFGLNCGLFTDSTKIVMTAVRGIRCGGIIVGGTSTFRPDQMPYGGVGMSGVGREGPSRAVQDMTEERLVVINC